MCKVTPISGKNDNNSRFLQVFLIFGQGGGAGDGANGANGANGHSAALAAHGEYGGGDACAITRGDVIRHPGGGGRCA